MESAKTVEDMLYVLKEHVDKGKPLYQLILKRILR